MLDSLLTRYKIIFDIFLGQTLIVTVLVDNVDVLKFSLQVERTVSILSIDRHISVQFVCTFFSRNITEMINFTRLQWVNINLQLLYIHLCV